MLRKWRLAKDTQTRPQGRQLMFTQWVTKGAILNIPTKELLIQALRTVDE